MGLLMSVHYLIYITSCRSLMEKNRPAMVPDTVVAKFHANKFDANKKDQEVKKLMPLLMLQLVLVVEAVSQCVQMHLQVYL